MHGQYVTIFYSSGSQPVARGPKVARQASKSGPRRQRILKIYVQKLQNFPFWQSRSVDSF